MTTTIWIIVSILLLVFEIVIPSVFFFFCLSIGSASAALAAYFNFSLYSEFAVFISVSIASVYFIRPVLKKVLSKSETVNSNVDALIGENAVVIEKITPSKSGFVRVSGEIWRAESDIEFETGETVRIKNVSGTTLIVKK